MFQLTLTWSWAVHNSDNRNIETKKRLKKDCCNCVMRNNASKRNEHANSISKDYSSRNFKCLSSVLLHLYDSHHRIYCQCIINFENFKIKSCLICILFKDIAACLKCYICESFDTHYKFYYTVRK